MRASDQRKYIDELLANLDQAEQCLDAVRTQQAYEDLFTFCQENDLDLNAVLQQPRTHEGSGIIGALKALWHAS